MPRQQRPPLETLGPAHTHVCLVAAGCLDLGQPYLPSFPARVGGRTEQENSGVPCGKCFTQHPLTALLKALEWLLSHHESCVIWPPCASLELSLVTLSSLQSRLLVGPQHSNPTLTPGSLHVLSPLLRRLFPQILARLVPSSSPSLY